MSDRDSFLAAIKAAPDDDAPRLIYADWLDERGDDISDRRAAFIRAQIADPKGTTFALTVGTTYGDQFREGPPYPTVWGSDPSPRDLAAQAAMFAEWGGLEHGDHIQYDRGFLSSISADPSRVIPKLDSLLADNPVRSVSFSRTPAICVDATGVRIHDHPRRWTDKELMGAGVLMLTDKTVLKMLGDLWPGVAFTLPFPGRIRSQHRNCRCTLVSA